MITARTRCTVAGLLGLFAAGAWAGPRAIPPETFPAPFGVNIHYTKGAPGETEMLADAFRVVRMDFTWHQTEREKGVYDFSAYDGLIEELDAHGLTPLFILDYGNDLYQPGPPRSPEAVAAFARWAAAAARHYNGRKIMWEFWNEPNHPMFWGGRDPDPEEYARLVNEAAPTMRQADPGVSLLVGATSGLPWTYIESLMSLGVLRWADAFTVHPYRSGPPETVAPEYARLRRLLHKYAPGKDIPILSSEWGYSTNTKTGISEERQARYLVRQRLINAAQGIRTSIWYDWKNDGPDPEENEHRFGTVTEGRKPKPSYAAARVMTETLDGYRFARMLVDAPEEYVMLLRNGRGETALAMWTTGPTRAYRVHGPIRRIIEMDGRETGGSEGESTVLYFGPSPRYVMLGRSAEMDARTMWWWVKPNTVVVAGQRIQTPGVTVVNASPERRRFRVTVGVDGSTHDLPRGRELTLGPGEGAAIPVAIRIVRRAPEARLRVTVRSDATNGIERTDTGTIPLTVANPLTVTPGPAAGASVNVVLESPMGGPETLRLALIDVTGLDGVKPATVRLAKGQDRAVASVPVESASGAYSYGLRVTDASGTVVAYAPPVRFQRFLDVDDDDAHGILNELSVHAEGDPKPDGSAALTVARDDERGVVADLRATFPDGWRYFVVSPEEKAIPEDAVAVGMWVKGDASGDALRCRFVDAKGQVYQPTYGHIDWTGWRWITMPLNDPSVGSWGGPQDGIIHPPIRWDSVFLLDSANQKPHAAHVRFDAVTIISSASAPGD